MCRELFGSIFRPSFKQASAIFSKTELITEERGEMAKASMSDDVTLETILDAYSDGTINLEKVFEGLDQIFAGRNN